MENLIKSYYLQHKAVFDENFKIVLDNFDMESIHKMRTSAKRLRALFELIEFLSDSGFKARKQLKTIRSLFKHAGKIREIQIEHELVMHYENILKIQYPAYKEYLKLREHKEIAAFLKTIPAFSKRDKILDDQQITGAIDSIREDTIGRNISDFLNWKKQKIYKLNSKPASNPLIHKNRTYMKQLYYLYEIITQISGQDNILNKTSEELREIEQLIGTWHDMVNSVNYMNAFFKTKNGEKSAEYLQLRKQIAVERKAKRQAILSILKGL